MLANDKYGGPTLNRHWLNASYLLGYSRILVTPTHTFSCTFPRGPETSHKLCFSQLNKITLLSPVVLQILTVSPFPSL